MQSLRWCAGATIAFGVVILSAVMASAQDAMPNKAKLEAGDTVYNTYCAVCHGDVLVSTGQFPNLRRLTANDRAKLDITVRNGRNQMPHGRTCSLTLRSNSSGSTSARMRTSNRAV
jgi:mono/diheme cytochrome c family protein